MGSPKKKQSRLKAARASSDLREAALAQSADSAEYCEMAGTLVLPGQIDRRNKREESPEPSEMGLGKRKTVSFTESVESHERGRSKTSDGATDRSCTMLPSHNYSIQSTTRGENSGTPLTRTHPHRGRLTGKSLKKAPSIHFKQPWKESRLWPARVESVRRESCDTKSITRGMHTVQMQAEDEDHPSNFIGDAYYYDLTKQANREPLEGQYTIVYTRPVGKLFDPARDPRCAVFSPSELRRMNVWTSVSADVSADAPIRQFLIPAGGGVGINFALSEFTFKDGPIKFELYLDSPDTHPQNKTPHMTTFTIKQCCEDLSMKPNFNPEEYPQYAAYPELMQIFSKDLTVGGHTIAFGIEDLEEYMENGEKVFTGYHFAVMEFSCSNPETRAPDRQLIVAVRLPKDRDRDSTSNLFILKQLLNSRHDSSILNGDPKHLAPYEYYQVDDLYLYNNPPRLLSNWRPKYESDVGLVKGEPYFSPTYVERHLFRVEDQIEELEKTSAWLQISMNESVEAGENLDERMFDAYAYVQQRYQSVKGELTLREEDCGLYDKLNEGKNFVDEEAMDIQRDSSSFSSGDYAKDDDVEMIIDQIRQHERDDERHGGSSGGRRLGE